MRSVTPKPLSLEAFRKFGHYESMIDPQTVKIGAAPIEFFRDMVPMRLDRSRTPFFSVNRVEKREMVINVAEYHDGTAEGVLPLDGDVYMFVAPAAPGGEFDPETVEVFFVEKGTCVTLNPGVWHHACFAIDTDAVNVLITLPERTYEIDCTVKELAEEDQLIVNV